MKERTAGEVVRLAADEGVEIVDLRFCDLPGLMQHFSVPAHELTEDAIAEGFGFDGSSIRGFQQIHESDMILLAGPVDRGDRPLPRTQDPQPQLLRPRPDHPRALLTGPAPRRAEGRAAPAVDRHRRHHLLRAGGGVLHLRQRPLLPGRTLRVLRGGLASRASGTRGARKARAPTSGTSLATRRGTSRSRRWTTSRISVPR